MEKYERQCNTCWAWHTRTAGYKNQLTSQTKWYTFSGKK